MKKTQLKAMLIVGEEVQAWNLLDWDEVTEAVEEHMQENQEDVGKQVRVVKYTDEVSTVPFNMVAGAMQLHIEEKKEINFGDEEVYGGETKYTIESHGYSGKEFDDLDELQDYIKQELERGELEEDDISRLDIQKQVMDEIRFDSFEMEHTYHTYIEGEGSIVDDFTVSIGEEVVLTSELELTLKGMEDIDKRIEEAVNKEMGRHDILVMRETATMADEEIEDELKLLYERMAHLQLEQKGRKVTIED